jgi:hypothetical protein
VITLPGDLLLVLVAITSVLAYVVGVRRLRLSGRTLARALASTLDTLGLALVFFAVNAGLGVTILLAARHLAGRVVTLHALDDITLMILSALQAIAFQSWRATRPG